MKTLYVYYLKFEQIGKEIDNILYKVLSEKIISKPQDR